MPFSDKPREPRAPRKARPRLSLKMQAIGFLSRREHSRQELRAKLLDALRKRAREDAALAAASQQAAQALAEALSEQPSNGIDDAFAPPGSSVSSSSSRTAARACDTRAPMPHAAAVAGPPDEAAPRAALHTLGLADGTPLPASLRALLERSESSADGAAGAPAASRSPAADAPSDDELEGADAEAAVDRLLDWLAANNYLSEARFVESRVNARSRKQGTLRIKLELSRHGLTLEPGQAASLRETEFARAQALWQRKFGAVAADARLRAKQARFLAARGFAPDIVRRVVGGEEEY
jgi:regulatory protein